jgi:TRAP-type C4-dicarboxylate transport system substrate-binding protein
MGLALTATALAADPIRLRASSQLPIETDFSSGLVALKARVETATGGAVTIELLHGERGISDQKIGDAIAAGEVEIGIVNIGNLATKAPAVDFIDYPFLLNFEAVVRAVADPVRPIRTLLDTAILEEAGLHVLWWQSYGSNVLFSKGRDAADITNVAGRRVRTHSAGSGKFLAACGATPVLIAATKQREALASGEVEFVMSGVAAVETRSLWQVADTITRIESAPVEFVVAINRGVWRRLPTDVQTTITTAAREIERALRDQSARTEARYYAFAVDKGMRIVELRPDQVEAWRACSWPVAERFMEKLGEVADRLMADYGQIRKEPCCSAPTYEPYRRARQ